MHGWVRRNEHGWMKDLTVFSVRAMTRISPQGTLTLAEGAILKVYQTEQ